MLLKSLELQGFKTFPDKTLLKFEEGITAVVGPNGSGKSNISDAMRWVLGEQSTRALRCTKMEDVIFNGTPQRKALGFAEVTLTIDNADRRLPFDNDTVAVTRRYYRSGESEYLINKNTVRLKDINELFMDTGLGRDGYSIIGQGKIDSIVAARSEDRREIFEEAAGISRYRYRKEESERRLSKAEENLVRLRDILSELEGRVEPLRLQAEKAEQFIALDKEKKGLEIGIWLETLDRSGRVLREHGEKISLAQAQHGELEEEIQSIAQRTEDLVGPYELHDFFLYEVLRRGTPPRKAYRLARYALGDTYDEITILKWEKTFYRRYFAQQFKRSCLPDGPKVGSAAVSPRGDLRMPSDACATLWLRELEDL